MKGEGKICSGEASKEFWEEINAIDEMSTGVDIWEVLYSIGCKMQQLEDKLDKKIAESNK